MQTILRSWMARSLVAAGAAVLAGAAPAQGWKPERNVELTIPTSPGGSNDIAGRTIHKLWGELKLLPVASAVVNRSGGETAMAVLGGHADVQITSVSTAVPHVTGGQMRAIAISSTSRLGGVMASVPTWRELGYPSSGSWKGIVAPKGLTPAQVAFWEEVMRRTAQSDEILQYAEKNLWLVEFKGSAETRKWLDDESAALRTIMTELGLIKP
jgi:putative tricarboxylic transport membrane protein